MYSFYGIGLMVQVIVLMLKICGFANLLLLQGSAGNAISPSPATFDAISPIGEGTPGSVPRWKQVRGIAPSLASQPNGSQFSPLMSAPVPETTKGLTPLLSPSIPTLLPLNNSAAPPIQRTIPSLPPSASHGKPPHIEDPGLVPEAPVSVPLVPPSRKTPEYPPAIHPVMPGSMLPSPQQSKAPDNKSPLFMPIAPVQIAPPPREILQKPPASQPIVREVPPSNFPVPAASPPHNLLRHPPPIHPTVPELPPSNLPVPATSPPPSNFPRYSPPMHPLVHEVPPSNLPEPDVSPISTPPPNFNWKRDGMPVVTPSNGMSRGLSPRAHSPAEAPVQKSPRGFANAPPPVSAINFPPRAGLHPPTPLPSTSFYRHHHARKNITSPAPSSYLVPPPASTDKGPFITPPPSYPPKLDPKSKPNHHAPQILNPESPLSPASPARATPSQQTKMPMSHSPASSPDSPLSPASSARATPSQQTKKPEVSPISTPPPSFNWKRDGMPVVAPSNENGMPVVAPSNEMPKGLSPWAHSPAEAPVQNSPRDSASAPPPVSAINFPPHAGLHPPTPLPSTSFYTHHHARKNITSPAPSSYLVPPPASTDKGPFITPPPSYPPKLDPKSKPNHHAPQILNPESPLSPASPARATPSQQTKKPEVSPISTPPPSFNWKRDGMPVVAPSNENGMPVVAPSNGMSRGLSPRAHSPAEALVQKSPRDSANAPPPVLAIKFPPRAGLHPPTPLPSTSFYRHHHARKNITSPAPSSYLVPPPASTDKGPFITPPPSYPPKLDPKSKPNHHAPQIINPESPLSPASPARATPSQQTKKPNVSPISTPPRSFNWKRDGMPVVAPSNGMPKGLSPWTHSPAEAPVQNSPRDTANAPPPVSAINFPPHSVPMSHSPASSPGNPLSPASPARATPSQQTKKPDVSPISTPPPSFNWKRDGMPVVAPSHGMPKGLSPWAHSPAEAPVQKSPRDFANAPPPVLAINFPPRAGLHPPTPLPSTSFYRHHHARKNITSPAPSSYLFPSPTSTDKGPFITPPPSYPPKLDPKSKPNHHAPQILNPVSLSHSPISSPESPRSPASPARATPSQQTKRNPKMPLLPNIQALPPPPPNEDCTSFSCTEPYTNTPPGSPCGCVLPMQVGLRLGVALYTFFPLVSELAAEIAVGVFMKQSQVRIMGANAASQDPEKTIVLIDLVPLGEMFDNTTAYLTYQRFWHKQVAISTYFFGDYEVLYVRYPGLPSSPPSAPLSIDGEPSAGQDGKGKPIKPLGVDVRRQQHKDGLKGSVIAIIVLSASIALILCCAVAWVLLFRRTERNSHPELTPPTMLPSLAKSSGIAASVIGSGPSSVSLSYNSSIAPYTGTAKTYSSSDIERATDNFDALRILGEGGFGLVYSGVLEDGTKVAVKVLKRDDQQGGREFLAEVEMLSRLHHRNLVRLIGICTEERARCLVYELIPNGSVESHLHGVHKEDAPLDWGARLKIALGAARGLAYLHEDSSPRVIHRDFKSSNILLELDFTPKVSDFGLARTALDEDNRHITTRVMGTFGYVAPEYAMTGHLLVKSDVYSYGVVLLELLTGRKPVDMSQPPGQENLVTWARPLLTSKEGLELMTDQSLGPDFPFDSIAKVAAIASMCVQPEVSHRPFMGEVVQALKLICNECDATRDLGSRSCSQEYLSVDFDARLSTNSGLLPDPLQMQSPLSDYVSALDVERGLPVSELFSASARLGRTDSGSFRRHSSSGPLRSAMVLPLWQRMRRLSGGSLSERGRMFRSWP